ncbi:MAG: sialidase family protein [Elusimicrobiota bacterium]
MEVTKKVLVPTRPGVAMHVNTIYRYPAGVELLQFVHETVASDTGGMFYRRFSGDNGSTWTELEKVYEPVTKPEGDYRWGETTFVVDPKKNVLVHFYNYHLYPGGYFTHQARKYYRVFYRISFDGGKTFTASKQVIQKGGDEIHWADGVEYGKNGLGISFCRPVINRNGQLLVPLRKSPIDEKYVSNKVMLSAGCVIGTWKNDGLEWETSKFVVVPEEQSTRGLYEPAIEVLPDGKVLMICRGSNVQAKDNIPGRKWYVLSSDGGYTWSEPNVLTYDDSSSFYAPSTGSILIRHSVNKKLYWFTNIIPMNSDGNRPRYPLQVCEIDEVTIAVKKETVAVIDDKHEGDSDLLQLSNFKVYEDRESHEFVLTMARIQEKGKELTSPAYEYRIKVY